MYLYTVMPIPKISQSYRIPTEGGANMVIGYNVDYRPSQRELSPEEIWKQPMWYFKDAASAKQAAKAWAQQCPGVQIAICRTELVFETMPSEPVVKQMSEKGLTPL